MRKRTSLSHGRQTGNHVVGSYASVSRTAGRPSRTVRTYAEPTVYDQEADVPHAVSTTSQLPQKPPNGDYLTLEEVLLPSDASVNHTVQEEDFDESCDNIVSRAEQVRSYSLYTGVCCPENTSPP